MPHAVCRATKRGLFATWCIYAIQGLCLEQEKIYEQKLFIAIRYVIKCPNANKEVAIYKVTSAVHFSYYSIPTQK